MPESRVRASGGPSSGGPSSGGSGSAMPGSGAADPGVRRNADVQYERSDISLYVIGIVALGILVLLGVTPLIMIGAFPLTRGDVNRHLAITPPEPRLQTAPATDLANYMAKESKLLDSYGWVDREHGIARIPIEEAMRRLAQQGIPEFPRTAPSPEQPAPQASASQAGASPAATHRAAARRKHREQR
ncbi:MAG TPA: hypothetical protein VN730_05755 [Steroidobacteraceae bacterium]|nr:hypothetical protein [Steroidobacteraceae bacterium]